MYSRRSSSIIRSMKQAEQQYDGFWKDLNQGRLDEGDYYLTMVSLKSYYQHTSFYEADSDKLVDQLMQYAFKYDTQEDPLEANKALYEYNDFLRKHITDIQVLYMAYNLSRQDASFGNSMHMEKLVKALEQTIFTNRESRGFRPEDAHIVSNYGEEKFILQSQGLEILEKETYEPNIGIFYSVYDVRDPKTDEEYKIFMDSSIPHNAMEKKAILEKESKPIVPKL